MPSTSTKTKEEKFFQRACLDLSGAGGEPPARPSGLNDSRSGLSEHLLEAVLGETRSGLGEELVEAALEQRRLKTAIRELPESERRRLAEAVLDQLAEDNELPEELNERVLDQMIGGMIAGKRSDQSQRSWAQTGCWAS
jgi:hypothetical protein